MKKQIIIIAIVVIVIILLVRNQESIKKWFEGDEIEKSLRMVGIWLIQYLEIIQV